MQPKMSRSLVRLVAALAIATILTGCSAAPTQQGALALATSKAGMFDMGCPAARLDGTLVADAGSGTAVLVGDELKPVIWPFGFTARDDAGVIEVVDASGNVVARTGEVVALSGGEITSDGRWSTCGPPFERH